MQAAHIRLADQASADKVYAELRNGLAFDEAVRRYSLADDRDRDPPGDPGLIRPQDGRLDLLRKTALIQKADTVSQPMRIDGAFEIVRVRSREDRQVPPRRPQRALRGEPGGGARATGSTVRDAPAQPLAGARVEGL